MENPETYGGTNEVKIEKEDINHYVHNFVDDSNSIISGKKRRWYKEVYREIHETDEDILLREYPEDESIENKHHYNTEKKQQ